MANVYGDAWINLLYDIDTEVRTTAPSEEVKKVHKIKAIKYLVIPGTDKKFPEGVFIGVDGITWQPKRVLNLEESRKTRWPKYDKIKLTDSEVGSIYPVTLIRRVIQVDTELKFQGIARTDSANQLIFKPGELEEKIESSKKEFSAQLKTCSLNPQEANIYFELVADFRRF